MLDSWYNPPVAQVSPTRELVPGGCSTATPELELAGYPSLAARSLHLIRVPPPLACATLLLRRGLHAS
jgi:hypothetical protein